MSEILFAFTKKFPQEYQNAPIIISGDESLSEPNIEFLLQKENDIIQKVFEIKYLSSGGPYKEAILFNNFLAVGHYQFFYLYHLPSATLIHRLDLLGYFGHLYVNDNKLIIADAGNLYCFDHKGKIVWKNGSLGIDGVFVSEFDETKIYGSGQWDPPDGWIDFILDKTNGRAV